MKPVGFLVLALAMPAAYAADEPPLAQLATIPLPAVKGRIDHMAIDLVHGRLFVAALGNDSVEVVDVEHDRHERSLRGFGEPQGVLYVAQPSHVYVASGSADRVDLLDGESLAGVKRIEKLADADNVRYEAGARHVWVGYGEGALRILDAASGETVADVPLPGHPESFQLERKGARIFVNVPNARQIAVVDRVRHEVIGAWPVSDARSNFPMALDEESNRLFVGARSPALLLVYDTASGKRVAKLPIGGDTDDLFFDAARKRLYVVCGAGRVDVIRQEAPDRYVRESSIDTAPHARTGFFVPEQRRLYVAAPGAEGSPARILVYGTQAVR